MSLAIVFDSAGTLLKTVRSVVNFATKELIPQNIETTMLTFEDPARLLVMLNVNSSDLRECDGNQLLSAWMKEKAITFGISCGRNIIDADEVAEILYGDTTATAGDLQKAVATCKATVSRENDLFALNAGVIVNTRTRTIEFGIAAAGYPFPGVRELISSLHKKGIAVYVASGDRTEKLEIVADKIGIPRNRVHGVATPVTKAQIVTSLKSEYDIVMMTGDGINDLSAMRAADVSVLTLQQEGERPEILKKTADKIIYDIRDVAAIADELTGE